MSTQPIDQGKFDLRDLTSYDLLKSLAVLLMVVDHVGLYFYPEEAWFRVIGRLCVPIWFFLIGYARTQDIPKTWWLAACLVAVSAPVSGQYFLPLNILFTLILARYWREAFAKRALYSPEVLRGTFLILAFAAVPSNMIVEYGTLGFLFVIMGYMVRHKQEIADRIKPLHRRLYVTAAFAALWLLQGGMSSKTTLDQKVFLVLGLMIMAGILSFFRECTYPKLGRFITPPVAFLVRFMGCQTLWIYVCHIILFRVLAVWANPQIFPLLEFKLMAPGIMAFFR